MSPKPAHTTIARANQRKSWALFAFLIFAGLWPLLIFGQPSYITDSSSYHRGGQAAWAKVVSLLPDASSTSGIAPPTATPAEAALPQPKVIGIRSIAYSVVAFVLAWPGTSLGLLVALQAFAGAFLLWLTIRIRVAADRWSILALPVLLGAASSFPVFATLATPDVWAGLMILSLILLTVHLPSLAGRERIAVGATLAFSVASHASHILLALSVLALAVLVLVARRRWERLRNLHLIHGSLALGVGLAVSFLSGLVAFGEATPVPKRYPFALARAVEDGPAGWYLEANCPTKRYAVCELFPDDVPNGVGDFLWARGGIADRATPEQMERIRQEEPEILRNAVAAYPLYQLKASARNVVRQFGFLAVEPSTYQGIRLDEEGQAQERLPSGGPMWWHVVTQSVAVLVSLLVFAFFARTGDPKMMVAIHLTLFLILINNLICSILSAPDMRYQARTLWLLPVLASLLVLDRHRRRSVSVSKPHV